MDIDDIPEPDYDFVERLLIRAGLVGFVIGLSVACVAIFWISERIASLIFPGA